MKWTSKGFIICLFLFVVLSAVGSKALAQSYYDGDGQAFPPWIFPTYRSGPNVSTYEPRSLQPGDLLVDDFEYENCPFRHGWSETDPPPYGPDLDYYTLRPFYDVHKESRVLDIYRPPSVFLQGTPYEHGCGMSFDLSRLVDAGGIGMDTHPMVGFELRLPLGIEPLNAFKLKIVGEGKGEAVTLGFLPLENGEGAVINTAEEGETLQIDFNVEKGLFDGKWHTVWINLADAVNDALVQGGLDPDDWGLERATSIIIQGRMFRLDNIIFRAARSDDQFHQPHLFRTGNRFARIFEQYRYLFVADYAIGDGPISSVYDFLTSADYPDIFITDPDEIAAVWVTEYGADPDRFGSSADPQVSAIMGRDFVIDPQLPIFANPNYRLGKNPHLECISGVLPDRSLTWHITPGQSGTQGFSIAPLEIDPYDGMPTYLPVHYPMKEVFEHYNKAFFGPEECLRLECALWNAGFTLWPNVAKVDFNATSFEDFTLTIEVFNGPYSDRETFPVCVVNYPVKNHAPVILEEENLLFYTREWNEHLFTAIDPDCMIFSLSGDSDAGHKPGTFEDSRTDMEGIYWEILNPFDLGCYCTINSVLDHYTGLLRYAPKFEGFHELVLCARDPYGASGIAEFGLFFRNKGTWLNYPPVILARPTETVIVKAGNEAMVHYPDLVVEDPDGDDIHASCNIGTCRPDGYGGFVWTLKTNFPGLYEVQIIFFDVRGGYSTMEFQVDVKTWWSF